MNAIYLANKERYNDFLHEFGDFTCFRKMYNINGSLLLSPDDEMYKVIDASNINNIRGHKPRKAIIDSTISCELKTYIITTISTSCNDRRYF